MALHEWDDPACPREASDACLCEGPSRPAGGGEDVTLGFFRGTARGWRWTGTAAGRLVRVDVADGHVGVYAADGRGELGQLQREAALSFALRDARGFR